MPDEVHAEQATAGLRSHQFVAAEVHFVEDRLDHLPVVAADDDHTVARIDVPAQGRHGIAKEHAGTPGVGPGVGVDHSPVRSLAAAERGHAQEYAAEETIASHAADQQGHQGHDGKRQQQSPASRARKAFAEEHFQCLVANDHAIEIEQHDTPRIGGGIVGRRRLYPLVHRVSVGAVVAAGYRRASAIRRPDRRHA